MTVYLALLVLVSAALHPLWVTLIKRDQQPETAFLGLCFALVVIATVHAIVAGSDIFAAAEIWPLLLLSWAGQMLYGVALVITLRRGDLSAYYPIIRSSPLLIVLIGVVFLGESYNIRTLAGIGAVLAGAFFLQYRPGVKFDSPMTLIFSIIAMAGTAIYSIADSRIMQVVPPPVMMIWVQALFFPSYLLVLRMVERPQPTWRYLFSWANRPMFYLGIGLICYASYYLILLAYQLGGDVAVVTSVRQASIPFSVLIGGLWLKEQGMVRRLWASLLLAGGIVVIVAA